MKKIFLIGFLIVFVGIFCVSTANAQQRADIEAEVEEIPQVPLIAVSGGDRNIVVGRQAIFSAAGSSIPENAAVEYIWNFGDGSRATGSEVVYTYRNPGIYRARLTLQNRITNEQSIDEFIVSVDKDLVILISDFSISNEQIQTLQNLASTQGILIINIKNETKDLDILVERELTQKIIESKENIKQAKNIIIWTQGNIGLNALIDAAQTLSATGTAERPGLSDYGFSNKVIISITSKFITTARLAQTLFNLVEPQFVVLAEESSVNFAVQTINLDLTLLIYNELII